MMTPDPAFRTIHCIPDGRQAAAGFLRPPAMDLLDLLVSVDLLEREGDGEGAPQAGPIRLLDQHHRLNCAS